MLPLRGSPMRIAYRIVLILLIVNVASTAIAYFAGGTNAADAGPWLVRLFLFQIGLLMLVALVSLPFAEALAQRQSPSKTNRPPRPSSDFVVLFQSTLDRLQRKVKDAILDWKLDFPNGADDPEE